MQRTRTRLLFALLIGLASSLGCAAPGDATGDVGTVRSPIVGDTAQVSTADEDFVLFVSHATDPDFGCGATLVAPNLVLTAKHCVNTYQEGTTSLCDATGEPQVGSNGGYTTGAVPPPEVKFYAGVSGRKRSDNGEPPDAVAVKYFDDGTKTLCSHDLAYVLLDRPVSSAPVGKLRLGRRPEQGDALALAGWGFLDYKIRTTTRYERHDLLVRRVGPPVVPQSPSGSLGPRTLETGPAGCTGDSGSPGFDPASGAVFGVIARAVPLDPSNTISACRSETVTNQYMVVADFASTLRDAFAAANAEPWREGQTAPGFARFGEVCASDLECANAYCLGATETTGGTCNLHCSADVACPAGTACDPRGTCQESTDVVPTSAPATDAGTTSDASAAGNGCSMTSSHSPSSCLWMIGLSLSLAFRSRSRRPRIS